MTKKSSVLRLWRNYAKCYVSKDISIEAKALYCYYMAHVGDNIIPSATQTCNDLMISYKRFKTLRTQLFERGFL